MDRKSILVFGVGELQESLIRRCKERGLYVVGVDPCDHPYCADLVDALEKEDSLEVAQKYPTVGLVTSATDKPLVKMAEIAEILGLPCFSVDAAKWSTDKFLMKQRFREGGIPCAKGRLISNIEEVDGFIYPVVVKPRDNSGSRGVKICNNRNELIESMNEALQYSHLDSVLVEEFIEGYECSIESLHYNGKSEVIQFTEKKTTPFPYNVELGHKQPANLSEEQKIQIREIVQKIAQTLKFDNCPSHTELKINERGIFVIETSPRLGGDYITSTLVPLSTGINMEDQLLHIALGEKVDTTTGRVDKASGVCFFSYPEGEVKAIDPEISEVLSLQHIHNFELKLKVGDHVNQITSSLNRYGQFIVDGETREDVDEMVEKYEKLIQNCIIIS